jgi:hypothetical protein
MTQPQVNQKPRCSCPQCEEGRRKFGTEKFDAMTDDFLTTLVKNMEEMAMKGRSKPSEKVDEPKVKIVGDVPPGLEPIIRAAISTRYWNQENLPKEDISFAEKYRLASIRKSTKDFDPEEDVWDEEDTMEVLSVDDDIEPEWLKQETSAQLQQGFEAAESEDMGSLLSLVEAMRQQTLAIQRMNASTLSILEVLSEQL